MNIFELSMIGLGLGMDAFAVSISKGLALNKMNWKVAIVVGIYFGFFQALMPLLGYISGKGLGSIITRFSGIITFILLFIVGVNMIKESTDKSNNEIKSDLNFLSMIILAIATSIDAFAVGITFSFFKINIWFAIFLIGMITFIISTFGVKIGNLFGHRYEKCAQILGGLILISIGIKSLIEQFNIF